MTNANNDGAPRPKMPENARRAKTLPRSCSLTLRICPLDANNAQRLYVEAMLEQIERNRPVIRRNLVGA